MKWIKEHWAISGFLLLVGVMTFGAGVVQKWPTDTLQWGLGNNSADKTLTINTGDGAGNPTITIDGTNKDFSFNKALKVVDALFQVGTGAAANQEIEFNIGAGANNPRFRWNNTSGQIEFSNNGTDFVAVGSGSGGGGGVNILTNPDAETLNTTGWTGSGSFTANTTPADIGFGAASYRLDTNTQNQAATHDLVDIPNGLTNANCLAVLNYKEGDGEYIFEVYDGTNVLATADLPATTDWKQVNASFVCPSSGQATVRIRQINVTDPPAIFFDNVHLGDNFLVGEASQAELAAHLYYPNNGSCNWSRTNTGFGAFGPVGACPPAVLGYAAPNIDIDVSDNDLPDVQFGTRLPPGRYTIQASFRGSTNAAASNFGYRLRTLPTGGNGGDCGSSLDPVTQAVWIQCLHTVDAGVNEVTSVVIEAFSSGGAVDINNDTDAGNLTYVIKRYPLDSQKALRPEQVAWHLNANQGGSAHVGLSLVSEASYIPPLSATLDTVTNPGSIAALQACSGAEEASGTTCSGSEALGISFDVPTAGEVRACVSFAHFIQTTTGAVATTWQVVETGNTDQVIIQDGKARTQSAAETAEGVAIDTILPHRLCGNFVFSSAGKKTLKLMYEQSTVGTVTSHNIIADRAGAQGARDIKWEVYPVNHYVSAPLIVDSLGTQETTPMKVTRGKVNCTGSSSITENPGGWMQSIGNIGSGDCVITLEPDVFSVAPICMMSPSGTIPNFIVGTGVITPTSVPVTCVTHAGVDCTAFDANVYCIGER